MDMIVSFVRKSTHVLPLGSLDGMCNKAVREGTISSHEAGPLPPAHFSAPGALNP